MNIGILASENSWYFRDLARAAASLGHSCERLEFARLVARSSDRFNDIGRFTLNPDTSTPQTLTCPPKMPHESLESKCNVILVRTMPPGSLEQVVFRMDALARLEASGTRVVNSPRSLECAVDKYLTTSKLQAAGLPVPETIVCEHEDDAMVAFEQLGGDVVVKPLFGSEGRGIVRVSDPDLAHRTFRTLMRLDAILYIQRFINHGGFDVRIMVLDHRVVGGIQRRSPDDFRTNVARQAVAVQHQPSDREIDFALRATVATGALIAGVDLLYDQAGNCYVIEVNAVPGWQAFGRVTGIDVATKLILHLSE